MEFIAKEIRKKDIESDIGGYIEYYEEILTSLVLLSEVLTKNKEQSDFKNVYYEAILSRFLLQSKSLIHLIKGTSLSEKEYYQRTTSIIDVSSLYLVSRSLVENFLLFEYLYGEAKNADHIDVRSKALEFVNICSNINLVNEHSKSELRHMREGIKNHVEFKTLPAKLQVFLNSDKESLVFDWLELFDDPNANVKVADSFHNSYNQLADTNIDGLMELRKIYRRYDSKISDHLMMLLQNQIIILSVLVWEYRGIFKVISDNYDEIVDPVTQYKIEYWNSMIYKK